LAHFWQFPEAILESPFWEGLALAFGLITGSFANVCVHRMPLGRSVVHPPSACPRCGARLPPWHNVPVLSYLLLRGRCGFCRAPISARYPAVEAANGLLYLGLALLHGPSWSTLVHMGLVTALLILGLIDLEHHLLPNAITRPGIVVGLLASLLPGPPTPLASAAAALAGYLALAVVAKAYLRARGVEGLGQGDWKLAAMLGAFLGWEKMLLTVFLAATAGTLVGLGLMALAGRDGKHPLPLGTFLGAAGILSVFVGDPIVAWYKGLLSP
jgi:leader peptidase (prepilin peptidase)/N-methyltransferase